jgi:hypothetical protein
MLLMSHTEPAAVEAAIGTPTSVISIRVISIRPVVQHVTAAYLRSALGLEDDGWSQARTDLQGDPQASSRLESK